MLLIIGLQCVGNYNKLSYSSLDNSLVKKYFNGSIKIKKEDVEKLFSSNKAEFDEDVMKIAVVYFMVFFYFLLPRRDLLIWSTWIS